MDKSAALDKIKKCLRLAKSSNPHEAAAALRQARALMREHEIGEIDVAAADASESFAPSTGHKRPVTWEVYLAGMVSECFGCERIYRSTYNGRCWKRGSYAFIGVGCYPEIAAYAYAVLFRQIRRARAHYIKTRLNRCRRANKARRADEFCSGWVWAVKPLVDALVPTQKDEQTIAAYVSVHYSNAVTVLGRQRRAGTSADRTDGYFAGKDANLNHGVGGVAVTPLIGSAPT